MRALSHSGCMVSPDHFGMCFDHGKRGSENVSSNTCSGHKTSNASVVHIQQRMKVIAPSAGAWFTTHGLKLNFKNVGAGPDYECYTKKVM